MLLLHLRLTHYIASYLRNIDEAHPIPPDAPIPIERTDPMYAPILFLLEPNRRNHINIDCLSDAQWRRMQQGQYLTEAPDGQMRFDLPRDPTKPLTLYEVYHLAGRDDLIPAPAPVPAASPAGSSPSASPAPVPAASPSGLPATTPSGSSRCLREAPTFRPIEEYITFALPDTYIIRGGREQRLTPEWYIPARARRVSRPIDIDGTTLFTDPCDELRLRFKLALDRYIHRGLQEAFAQGLAITKMALLDRFMTRYAIRPGDREREQLKKVMQRSQNARTLSFDADSTTPIVTRADATSTPRATDARAATTRATDAMPILADQHPLPTLRPAPKRVLDLTTGHIYPSIRAAARALGCTHNEILACIARQGTCRHHRLDYADQ